MPMMESEYSLTRPQVSTEPDTSPKLFSPRLNLGQLATNHQHFYLRSICSTALIAVADLIAVAEPSSITHRGTKFHHASVGQAVQHSCSQEHSCSHNIGSQ
jgi:hypothetical protein